jgi:uncharacterized protein YjbJ (UPF0337 family)
MERRSNTMDHHLHSGHNAETFGDQWTRMKGQVRMWWDRLSESDLEQVSGQKERLVRLLQEKYGYARERAEQEIGRHFPEQQDVTEGSAAGRQGQDASTTVGRYASNLAATAGGVGAKVQDMASSAATSMAGTVSGAGGYLQDLPAEITGLIRRHPIPSLLVGIGIGFLLGRSAGQMPITSWRREDWQGDVQQHEAGYPDAAIQCVRCGQLVRQRDMVSHSTTCTGTGIPGHGGSPT